jgi:uncharacterized protein YcfL
MDGGLATKEVNMKKYIVIIMLILSLSACSMHNGRHADDHTLLSFSQLANEITVAFEVLESSPETGTRAADKLVSP